ncbi:Serine/threonine protein kinase [Cryobacterium luteum]|uniref:non-specific serine/threonine protein kinase n=1 Tax=Cryobacterium luteum TaxID=1424661 RepID=A0A1H8FRD9_9MICO|nr:serine/threonine protein kinase [Cryobacterium luteum]SEN34303.1 Serine/threonine protein kinase [Cryobacterium luteum]
MWFARRRTHQEVPLSYEPVPTQQLPVPPPLGPVGSLLADRFLLGGLIGTGGMASVYRATDTALGRTVAVKLFRADGGASEPERQSGEIALLASLNHFALVTLFDAGTTTVEGVPRTFIVMELVDGPDLRTRINDGPVPSVDVAGMGADLAEALHYVHERGIIHRDVKPANVLLAPSGFPGRGMHAKLADFGIARLLDETRLTATGSLLGTASYLSPEQALGAAIGAPTDVYSLGLVLLECLTGQRAYPGTAVESAMARLQRQPEIPNTLGRDWSELLASMTAREAADRPTAAETAGSLRALATESAPATATESATAATRLLPDLTPAPTRVMPDLAPAPTLLLAAAEAAPTEVLKTDAPAHAPAAGTGTAVPVKPRRPASRRVPVLIASGVTLIALAIAAALLIKPAEAPAVPPPSYPAVDGTLGVHLQELQESVNP